MKNIYLNFLAGSISCLVTQKGFLYADLRVRAPLLRGKTLRRTGLCEVLKI
jgi:hypothetical protein